MKITQISRCHETNTCSLIPETKKKIHPVSTETQTDSCPCTEEKFVHRFSFRRCQNEQNEVEV